MYRLKREVPFTLINSIKLYHRLLKRSQPLALTVQKEYWPRPSGLPRKQFRSSALRRNRPHPANGSLRNYLIRYADLSPGSWLRENIVSECEEARGAQLFRRNSFLPAKSKPDAFPAAS